MRLRALAVLFAVCLTTSVFAATVGSASLSVSDPSNYLDAGTSVSKNLGNATFSFVLFDTSGDSDIEDIWIRANDTTDTHINWFIDIGSSETLKTGSFNLADRRVFFDLEREKNGDWTVCSADTGTLQISTLRQEDNQPFQFSASFNVRCGTELASVSGGVSIAEGVSNDPGSGGGTGGTPSAPPVTAGMYIANPLQVPPPQAGAKVPPPPPLSTLTLFLPLELGDEPLHMSMDSTAEVMTTTLATSLGFPAGTELTVRTEPEGLEAWFPKAKLGVLGIETSKLMLHAGGTPAGRYKVFVTATASKDAIDADSFLVDVFCDPPSLLAIDQPQAATVAPGSSASWTVTPSGSGPFTYQWFEGSTGQTNFPVASGTSATLKTGPLANTTQYWVRIANACGSVDSHTATANVTGR